jgi:dienelactone hydrolase
MKRFFLLLTCLLIATPVLAEVKTIEITYKDGDTTLTGYLAWDDALPMKQNSAPAVLIVHQWMGLTDYEKGRAKQLAELGYVAFALDIYGVDNRPKDRGQAGAMAGKFKNDRKLFRKRLNLGLDMLKKVSQVDPKRVAAIGYCFGGTGVLELARSGADVAGVVSFHGGLDAPTPEDAKNIKAKVLVCHGADDPFVSQEGIDAMTKSFNEADVDWQMIYYSNAVHSFTQPMAGDDPSKGAAYNEKADLRSWLHMQTFFYETIEAGPKLEDKQ